MDKKYRRLSVITWLVIIGLWFLSTNLGWVSINKLPKPQSVIMALFDIVKNGYNDISFWKHFGISFYRLLLAVLLAILTAIPLGLLSGYFPKFRAVLSSLINFYRPLPPLAYYTILIIWLGIAESSKIMLLFLASFAPIFISASSAVGKVNEEYILSAKTFGANNQQIFKTVIIPATMPDIFVGIRTAVGVAYTTLVSAEMVAATAGLGWMVFDAHKYLKYDIVFAIIIIMGISGVALDVFLRKVGKDIVYWNDKKYKKVIVFMLVLLLLLVFPYDRFTGKNGLSGDYPSTIKIGTIRVPNDKTVAIEKGYFEEVFGPKGIKTEYIFFDSGTSANQALASGKIHFAEMGHTNAVVAQGQNLDVELIWIHEVLGSNEALVVKDHIQTVEDLRGKKVATPFSSTSHLSLLKTLEKNNIDPKELTILDMDTADVVAAWKRDDIDASYIWEPGLSELLKSGGRVLINSEDLAKEGIITANIDLANKTFAHKYPDLVADYISVLSKSYDLYSEDRPAAIEAASKRLGIDMDSIEKQMNGTIWLAREEEISKDYLASDREPGGFHKVFMDTAVFLKDQGKIEKLPSEEEVREFINSSYIERSIR